MTYTETLGEINGRLATIEEHARSIDKRLNKLNGQIAMHVDDLEEHTTQIAIIENHLVNATKWRDRLGGAAATGVLALGLFVLEKLL
jgi:hypothetical protein